MIYLQIGSDVDVGGRLAVIKDMHLRDGLLTIEYRDTGEKAVIPRDQATYVPRGDLRLAKNYATSSGPGEPGQPTEVEMKKPDFASLTLDQQLVEYNKLAKEKRKSKFPSKEAGIKALEKAWAEKNPAEPKTRTSKRTGWGIKVLTAANPRRAGTAGFDYFEAMKTSKTIGDYLAKFKDKKKSRDARLWLYYNIRDGHVEVVKA